MADLAEECKDELVESTASVRLGRRVDAMISRLDMTLQSLDGTTAENNRTLKTMTRDKSVDERRRGGVVGGVNVDCKGGEDGIGDLRILVFSFMCG